MVLSLVWYWYKITCVSGSFRDSSADSRAEVANIAIGIVGEMSASLPTVVART